MRLHLATDKELMTIIKYDTECTLSLMREVVIEMLNRNQFDALIARCFKIVFGSIKRMNELYKLEMDDFLQMGRIEIYQMLDKFNPDMKTKFSSFAFKAIKDRFSKYIRFLEAQQRDERNTFSYNAENDNDAEFLDLFASKQNVEKYVMNKVTIEQMLERVNEHQKKVLFLRLKGYKFGEISELLGRGSEATMSQAYKLAIKKMSKGA